MTENELRYRAVRGSFNFTFIVIDLLRTDDMIERYTLYKTFARQRKYYNMVSKLYGTTEQRGYFVLANSLMKDGATQTIHTLDVIKPAEYAKQLEFENR